MKKLALIAALGSMLMLAVPAQAKGPLIGLAAIQCDVTLGAFPVVAKTTNATPCTGTATGAFAGLTNANEPVAGIAALSGFSASVQYDEQCVLNEPPLVGFANGRITVSDITVVDPLGAVLGTGTFTTSYDWTRVGLTALVFDGKLATKKGPLQSELSWAGGTRKAQDLVGSVALAAFAPLVDPTTNTCPAPGGPLTASVVAVDLGA